MEKIKIFTFNVGSTSTKYALFENYEKVFEGKAEHDPEILKQFSVIWDQSDYRKETILEAVKKADISLNDVVAVVGRSGGTGGIPSGTYEVEGVLLETFKSRKYGKHTADIGGLLAYEIAKELGARAFIVNSPDTDEFQDVSRLTGLKRIYRKSSIHALNQKENGIRYGKKIGRPYNELNLVIVHAGGGISVTAHKKGKMIDSNNIISGEGPMAPTRSGALPATEVIKMCYSGNYTEKEMMDKVNMRGGLLDHLGTTDILEIHRMIDSGDQYAKLVYDTMIYQIGKFIGSMASALHGEVDAIILTGGISRDKYFVESIRKMNSYIAEIVEMPGEFEMEALAAGAYRVLTGEEMLKEYTGKLVWTDYEDIIKKHEK